MLGIFETTEWTSYVLCLAPTAPVCRSLAVSQSAEEATEAIEVSEEAGPNETEESTLGPFTEHVFTDNTHRYLTYSPVNHKKTCP